MTLGPGWERRLPFLLATAALLAGRLGAADVVPLHGPWKFHLGDDPRWAAPAWDDRAWETVDLTPAPGAHDDDVGLTGFVGGWTVRGHPSYSGYAWYRIRVERFAPELALAGPPAIDSAYQVFADGHLLGGLGSFSGAEPTTYGILPRVFALPSAQGGMIVIAFRVWMGRAAARVAGAGGIRIAPAVGRPAAIARRYREQWRQTFLGYIVEVAEAAAFLALAVLAAVAARRDPGNRSLGWVIAGLLLLAVQRGNQAVYFWAQVESTRSYDVLINFVVIPLALASWSVAVWRWAPGAVPRRIPGAIAAGVGLYLLDTLLVRSWVSGDWPTTLRLALGLFGGILRWGFLGLFLAALVRFHHGKYPRRGLEAGTFLLVAAGLFSPELSKLHVPSIWFPFGVGVSRTQYAYAAFDFLMGGLLVRRLRDGPAIADGTAHAD